MTGNPAFRRPSKARLTTYAILQRAVDGGLASIPGGMHHRARLLSDMLVAAAKEITSFPPDERWPPERAAERATAVAFVVLHVGNRYIDEAPRVPPGLLVAASRVLSELVRVVALECPLPTWHSDELRKVATGLVVAALGRRRRCAPPAEPEDG